MKSLLEKLILIILFFGAYYGILYSPNLPVFINEFNTIDGSIYVARFLDVITSLIILFTVSFYLTGSVLLKKQIVKFILFSIVLISVVSFIEYRMDILILQAYNLPTSSDFISDKMLTYYRRRSYDFPIIPVNIIIYILGLLYGLSRDWIRKSRTESRLATEKMKADIELLRSQINPHFFFNALNNIYAITQRNNDTEAEHAILKLSGIMRYMIYESDVKNICLERELENVEDYIEVSKLKYSKNDSLEIVMTKKGEPGKYKIAPLLLIPFVENSFKHGISSNGEGYIQIEADANDKNFVFRIENSKSHKNDTLNKLAGVGLENVIKRLKLLYGGKSDLNISDNEDKFTIVLNIDLEDLNNA
ncbi:MAG: hypothetical protein GY863_10920 [bacterium]|nr:hypothetical protein [bacterium]